MNHATVEIGPLMGNTLSGQTQVAGDHPGHWKWCKPLGGQSSALQTLEVG